MQKSDIEKLNIKKPLRIKIVSMGEAETGKSCIIKRYCEKRFVHKYLATIGIDYGVTRVNVKGVDVKVNIFDMAGHPIFYEVRNEFYKDTQGAILCFDVSCRKSFEKLDQWLAEMRDEIGSVSDFTRVVLVLCANKTDKKRCVFEPEARLWASNHNCAYFETCAQTGVAINTMFDYLFEAVVTTVQNGGRPEPVVTQLGYTKEQADAIQKLKNSRSDVERLGVSVGASKEEINRAYRRLAILLHPDKSVAPGAEDAFKILVEARTNLLRSAR